MPRAEPRRARRRLEVVVLVGCLVAGAVVAAERPTRGYQPRACGFDLDDDGVVGEPIDDCRICDGLTTDPDGDGDDEDLYYIDCDTGFDNPACGAPWAPCATIEHTWSQRANGPDVGQEDILCFRGTCLTVENYSPPHGGIGDVDAGTGFVVHPATGSQARDWRAPRDPAMLVGWDSDQDRAYPPFDTDDVAILAGGNRSRAFRLGVETSFLEMAHFTVQGYGRTVSTNDSGFVRWGPSAGVVAYQHFHDLALLRINMDRDVTSGNALINLFPSTATPRWLQFSNLDVVDNGQWFVRGSGYDDKMPSTPDMGPFRFINITRTAHSCDASACGSGAGSTAFKLWSYVSGVEILDSIWDANVDAWQPSAVGGASGSSFANPSQCTRDWVIRNNEILDYKNVLTIDGYTTGFCDGSLGPVRTVDDIVFDGNRAWNTYEPWDQGDQGIRIDGIAPLLGAGVGDITITNNLMGSSEGWEAAVWIRAGSQVEFPSAIVTVAHNTFYGNPNRHGAIVIGNVEGSDALRPLRHLRIHHNVVDGLVPFEGVADYAVLTTYAPSHLVMDANTYDHRGRFGWLQQPMGFAVWRPTSGVDAASRQCSPTFVDIAAGDLHLADLDTCAVDRGGAVAPVVTLDVDGDSRTDLPPIDIGGDELSATIFTDGFESGNTARWILAVGG